MLTDVALPLGLLLFYVPDHSPPHSLLFMGNVHNLVRTFALPVFWIDVGKNLLVRSHTWRLMDQGAFWCWSESSL